LGLAALGAALVRGTGESWPQLTTEHLIAIAGYLTVSGAFLLIVGRYQVTSIRAALAEGRLRLAQEDTGVGVYELDFVHNTAFVSPSMRRLLGQPPSEGSVPLDQWLAELHPDHVSETRQVLAKQVERGELRYERESQVTLRNGKSRWLLTRVRIELSADGKLAVARGAALDVTERKHLDQQLRIAQTELREQIADMQRLHALSQQLVATGEHLASGLHAMLELVLEFHGARHGFVTLHDAEAGAFLAAAQSGLNLTHAQLSSGLPCPPSASLEEHLRQHQQRGIEWGYASVHCHPLRSANGEVMGMVTVMMAAGHEWNERALRLGEVCASMAAAVVERERERAAAAAKEQRFAVVLESAAVPFNILAPVRDANGLIVDLTWQYANPAAGRVFGSDVQALIGRRVTEILPLNWSNPGLLAKYSAVIDGGEVVRFETESIHHPGTWLSVTASPLQGAAAVWFADISEQKRQERIRQDADRRKDEFVATLAHELRNPLAPIRQSLRIAGSADATDAQRRWSRDVIERQVRNMALLLDDLLDVSRISRGTLVLRRELRELGAIVNAAVEVARPHIENKGHELRIEMTDATLLLDVDPLRLSQVIGNLLTNAAKYTDPGGKILLRAGLEGSQLSIRVRDSGIGLTQEQLGHVFEMFAQASAALGRSQGGLGIGLSLARNLVNLHGGDIVASSDGPGQGSEFTILLPAGVIAAPNRVASRAPDAGRPAPLGDGAVLVADDNRDAANSLAELLRLGGQEVHVAYDGDEAIAAFECHRPASVLLDLGMPRISGLQAARIIRGLPGGEDAVLVAITGWGQSSDRRNALEAGFDHHLTKPVDPVLLPTLIASTRAAREQPADLKATPFAR
jgi:PAS domain S-box-containing protein